MTTTGTRMRQVMDWRAAVQAGLIAGVILLILMLIGYPVATGGSAWTVFRFIGSLLLGREIIGSPDFNFGITVTAIVVHLALSVVYAWILAFIIHRWGLIIGFIGGAVFGLALFAINFYTFTLLFPWFTIVRTWQFVALHILFGTVAGTVYELLEEDILVPEIEG